jgi:hypothetical protein
VLGDDIRRQVCRLIPTFGVEHRRAEILRAFETLCGESLTIAAGQRSPDHSRINADGTPFQFALDLSASGGGPFQFLGEAGPCGAGADVRRRAAAAAWRALVEACRLDAEADAAAPLLGGLIPETPALPANLCWFAVRYPVAGPPAVTLYVNGAWGSDAERWGRLDTLAAAAGATPRWRRLRESLGTLAPLGAAITVRSGTPPAVRVYVRGYGLPVSTYRDALTVAAPAAVAGAAFDSCAAALLGDDVRRPTQSVVVSADLAESANAGGKVEFCTHCAFSDDAEASRRIGAWLRAEGLGEAAYRTTVDRLTDGATVPPAGRHASLHAFAGVGIRGDLVHASVYLNPGAVLDGP